MRVYSDWKKYKKMTFGILLASFCLFGQACGIRNDGGYAVQEGGTSQAEQQEGTVSADGTSKIQVYTMDPDSLEAEAMTVKVDAADGLTAQVITDAVLDLFEAQGTDIGVNTVEQVENTVIVDFDSTKAPLSGVGSAEETAILDCISMSLLDNLSDCQQVVFHADGERYESGHYGFELNEAYKWKN